MRLTSLKKREVAEIIGIDQCEDNIYQRLLDLGFVKGTKVTIESISPLGDPIAYCVYNTQIALRCNEAKYILIKKI